MNKQVTSLPSSELTMPPVLDRRVRYNDCLVNAAHLIEDAAKVSQGDDIEAAGELYDEARTQLSAALYYRPPAGKWEIDGSDDDNGDPALLLVHGYCTAKLLESDCVRPYSTPIGGENRKQNLTRIARGTFYIAWKGIKRSNLSDEEKATCGIVATDGLTIVKAIPEANEVIGFISDTVDPKTDSWMLSELVNSDHWLKEAHRLGTSAVVEVAGDLELLSMAA